MFWGVIWKAITLYRGGDHSVRREKIKCRILKTMFPYLHSCEGICEEIVREEEGNPGDCNYMPGWEGPVSFKEDREVKQKSISRQWNLVPERSFLMHLQGNVFDIVGVEFRFLGAESSSKTRLKRR